MDLNPVGIYGARPSGRFKVRRREANADGARVCDPQRFGLQAAGSGSERINSPTNLRGPFPNYIRYKECVNSQASSYRLLKMECRDQCEGLLPRALQDSDRTPRT